LGAKHLQRENFSIEDRMSTKAKSNAGKAKPLSKAATTSKAASNNATKSAYKYVLMLALNKSGMAKVQKLASLPESAPLYVTHVLWPKGGGPGWPKPALVTHVVEHQPYLGTALFETKIGPKEKTEPKLQFMTLPFAEGLSKSAIEERIHSGDLDKLLKASVHWSVLSVK
jgi:hypothetical protein